ncbi:transcription elongation factor GreA [Sphingomonas sp. PP-CE-1A-559]|nr:transcription elongation factor GreA [Sphingomonas sp. PP-CE-3G-477]PTW49291.1 transcription elongation factor GreA [Sphingomonas faeni]RMB37311.1 transcription elongation factor GreA [Sphingomonas sp. PP-F2F-G114-C0414]RMB53996.1 transcription elongation factor GreA [Sphingomonas sp. PP-CE-3A-406]TCP71593.1 transcription elongation factor GreA [Sphingomonas sp. PP-CE-1G-424]TCP94238.1 transcription elongation factor GreA [Sphingomonas sp. PP-CE-1A-559]TCP98204.1 transcription elongation f
MWAGLVQGLARGNGFGDEMMATVEKMPMLQEGYETLSADLKRLKAERPTIVDAIEEARAHGDLSENAEYHAAKERQGQVEASISDIEDKLSRAQIIDPKDLSGDKVVFGATVTLLDENDKPVKYQIVGQTEANAKTGRISYNSPLGRGLIGRKLDEEVEVTVPAGERYYVVSKIEFI